MRKNIMNKLLLITSLVFSSQAYSFQCPRDHSPESAYQKSNVAYVAKINAVEFFKDIKDRKHAKYLLVKFDVVEVLKGKKEKSGEVLDVAGIGTGFVNFIPGGYYIITHEEENLVEGKQYVNMCDVLGAAFYLEDEMFSKTLEIFE